MYLAEPSTRYAPCTLLPGTSPSHLRRVRDASRTPFRWVCRLLVETQHGHSIGSAILLSPWHALTAAHVIYPLRELYHRDKPYQTVAISACPGYDSGCKLHFDANGWVVSPNWDPRQCETNGYDWGIVRLAKPVPSLIGYWSLSSFAPSSLARQTCIVAGYSTSSADAEATEMFQSTGTVRGSPAITDCTRAVTATRVTEDADGTLVPIASNSLLIVHDAASEESMSGGPVWIDGDSPKLIALHAGTLANSQCKKAVLLTPGLQADIRRLMSRSLPPLQKS